MAQISKERTDTSKLPKWSDYVKNAILKKIVEFIEPPPEQLTPIPTRAIVNLAKGVVGPLYHGTTTGLLQDILREGLRPWKEIGERIGTIWAKHEIPMRAGVYLTRDPAKAWTYAAMAASSRKMNKLPGAGEPVVLRVTEVPISKLLQDEDVARKARYARRYGKDVPSGWKTSFVFHPEQVKDIIARAQLAVGEEVPDAEKFQRIYDILDSLYKRKFWGEDFSGLGTVAHRGSISPDVIAPVGSEKTAVLAERKALHDRLARLMMDIIARGEELPWWLQ